MKEEAVNELLIKDKGNWDDIKRLILANKIIEIEYEGDKYYIRNFK